MESPGPDFGESVWEEMAMKIGLFSEINGGYLFLERLDSETEWRVGKPWMRRIEWW